MRTAASLKRFLGGLRQQRRIRPADTRNPELAEYILNFCAESAAALEYARTHLARLVRTLEITPQGGAADSVLEMGAYMQITPALKTIRGYGEVRGCYIGPLGEVHAKTARSTTGEEFSCSVDLFNAERDRYPYGAGRFAAVICCEMLEHLMEDPMRMASEINRILRPGGRLVMSTPNICSLRSVAAVLCGSHPGVNAQYTIRKGGNEAEPRHIREYTPDEVRKLIEAAGFVVERLETGPYGFELGENHGAVQKLLTQRGFPTHLRDACIHAVGRKTGPVRQRYPDWLYA